jgi:hypothetical protein
MKSLCEYIQLQPIRLINLTYEHPEKVPHKLATLQPTDIALIQRTPQNDKFFDTEQGMIANPEKSYKFHWEGQLLPFHKHMVHAFIRSHWICCICQKECEYPCLGCYALYCDICAKKEIESCTCSQCNSGSETD